MIIRDAEEKDVQALSSLLAQLGYPVSAEECLKRIHTYKKESYKLLVGELNGVTIGFIALHWYNAVHHARPIGRVIAFCVDESLRGKGLGSVLLNYVEDFFKKLNCVKTELTSNLRRKESHSYYFNRGYQEKSMHFVKFLE